MRNEMPQRPLVVKMIDLVYLVIRELLGRPSNDAIILMVLNRAFYVASRASKSVFCR